MEHLNKLKEDHWIGSLGCGDFFNSFNCVVLEFDM